MATQTLTADALPCGPDADGHDRPYWEGLREGRVVLPRCGDCDAWLPLGRVLCDSCWSFDVTWSQVEPVGEVFTWIRTHRDFMSELDVRAPYLGVLVQLDDVPLRLLGLFRGDAVAIGDRVRGVVERPANAEWPVLRWVAA